MIFGAYIPLWTLGIPNVTGYRQHLYEITGGKIVWPSVNGPIPVTWPCTPTNVLGFYTLYPNPDDLLAGKLDAQLCGLIGSAPSWGGALTAYAEADGDASHGGQFAPLGLTKDKLHEVHAYMQALCQGSRVKYGSTVCGPGLDQVSFGIPGLDFYALDWYDSNSLLFQVLNDWRANTESYAGGSPVLAIAETNSNQPLRRPYWFSAVYGWLRGYELENGGQALGYWSYWRRSGIGLSGPWLPDDKATIEALTDIANDAATY